MERSEEAPTGADEWSEAEDSTDVTTITASIMLSSNGAQRSGQRNEEARSADECSNHLRQRSLVPLFFVPL